MKKTTKFVGKTPEKDPLNGYLYEKMAKKIANEAQISPELIKKYGKEAFEAWEKRTGRPRVNLFEMRSEDRAANIYEILSIFRRSLEPYVPSVKTMDKSMCIANVSLELMFERNHP